MTTPESLYILLGSESGRRMLATTRTVIVDEIHALAANKRGTHLTVSLERLKALCGDRLQRIGLSATQKPIEAVARFLVGAGTEGTAAVSAAGGRDARSPEETDCTIIDTGHRRARDLALEMPASPLEAVMSHDVWSQVYDRLAELIEAHRTTLIFVNTRRLAERATRQLSERIGEAHIAAHHGSLAKEARLDAEQRLKRGEPAGCWVATASLELGIDIGDVDLVCQIGSPRSIASFLQRVGRSGHAVDGTPKGRLFPLSRDELVECAALLDSVRRGELDTLVIPELSLDVLAQQIIAEVAAREWSEDGLFALIRGAWPYRNLPRKRISTPPSRCWPRGSAQRGALGAARRCFTATRSTTCYVGVARCADHRADLGRHQPRHRRLPGCCSNPKTRSSARSTRIGRSKALPATCSNSATPPTAFSALSGAPCASRTPRARRPACRFSGSARAPGRSDELSASVVTAARGDPRSAGRPDRRRLACPFGHGRQAGRKRSNFCFGRLRLRGS